MLVRLRRVGAAALAAHLAAWGAACGDTEGSANPPPSVHDIFARQLAVEMCQSVSGCCLARGLEEPGEQCHTKMRNAIIIEMIELEREKRSLRPANVEACLDAFRAALHRAPDCESMPTPVAINSLCPDLFGPIPEGEGAPGSACVGTYDCRSPTIGTRQCVREWHASTGVCEWSIPVGEGEACAPSPGIVRPCSDGWVCGPTATCVAPGELGELCASGSCASGLVCTVFTGTDPLCVGALGPGEDCSAMPDACREDHFCGVQLTCDPLPDPCADGCEAAFIFENVCLG